MAFVGICSTYNEGRLALGAVECLLECCDWVQVCDGPIRGLEFDGARTELAPLRRLRKVDVWEGVFASEIEKRNAMLDRAKLRRNGASGPVWLVYLDGDELLNGARYLPDLVDAAAGAAPAGEEPGAVPLPIVDADLRKFSIGLVHRIFRADVLVRHVLSMSQFLLAGSSAVVTLPLVQHDRLPLQGEPHILHRAYYRPARSERTRLHVAEIEEMKALERAGGFAGAGGFEHEGGEGFGPVEISVDEQAVLRELQGRR